MPPRTALVRKPRLPDTRPPAPTTAGHLATARALIARNRRDEALHLLHHASRLDPRSADTLRLLATTLMEAGRFAEAEQHLTQAAALDPAGAAHYHSLANLRRMTPTDRPLIDRMTSLLHNPGTNERDRMLLHFALGKAHDDLHEFAAAIGHFDAANRIRGASAPLDRRALVRLVDRNIDFFSYTANRFDATLGVPDDRPVFFLGLPRSGTTLVEQILSCHPRVTAGGELAFWPEHGPPALASGEPLTPDRVRALATGYQSVLAAIVPDAARITDKNLINFLTAGLLRLAFPRAFFIHCRRHPVDTCLSMYTTFLGSRDTLFMGNRDDLVFYYRQYSRLMQHWREVLPGRFLETDYEALTTDREAQTRGLVAFCELEWHDACLRPERNPRTIITASRWQARQPVYRSSVGRWRNYRPWLGPLAELLSEAERAE